MIFYDDILSWYEYLFALATNSGAHIDTISAFIVNVQSSRDGFTNLFREPAQRVCADQDGDLTERMEDHADELHVFFYDMFGELRADAFCEFRLPLLRQRKLLALLAVLNA